MTLTALREPAPPAGALLERPDLLEHRERPPVLILRATRADAVSQHLVGQHS